jgi:DNA gyrase subunit B
MKYGAYLTPGVTFKITSEISGHEEEFCYEGGIRTWLENIAGDQQVVTPQISMTQDTEDCAVDLTFKYVDSTNDTILSFVNNIITKDHGTHVTGFKNALLDVINELTKDKGKADTKIGEFQPSDITDGLYAIITVKIPEPQFE